MDLLEKKLQRVEAARMQEVAQLTAELEGARNSVAEQLSAKDAKVNDLVEELGNTQALLSEKEAALAEVRSSNMSPLSCSVEGSYSMQHATFANNHTGGQVH